MSAQWSIQREESRHDAQIDSFFEQLPTELRDLVLVAADALLTPAFLGSEVSEDLYIVGPIATFGNVNSETGQSEAVVKQTIETAYGDTPGSFWQHSYDATTLLLSAIESVVTMSDGTLCAVFEQVVHHLPLVLGGCLTLGVDERCSRLGSTL